MRWEALFDDLEAQLASAEQQLLDGEIAERVRIETGTVTLLDRARARLGHQLRLWVAGSALTGVLRDVGADYLLLAAPSGPLLVPVGAVDAVSGLGRQVRAEQSVVRRRLGLREALRALARDRAPVRLLTRSGELAGLLSRVGADHVDLVPAAVGESAVEASAPESVRLAAILQVCSAG